MRINKFIASKLGISRRKADEIIAAGRITVDGIQPSPGLDVTDDNAVLIDGRELPQTKSYEYILLNKPVGYVCSRDGQGSNTIYDLLPHKYDHLNPVGRLDKDSQGLLLLTNDGNLHNELTHPSNKKEKIYVVKVHQPLVQKDAERIESGVQLDDGTSALTLKPLDQERKLWEVRMHEGRNRQIRRTFQEVGYKITMLKRTGFGTYKLNEIPSGSFTVL